MERSHFLHKEFSPSARGNARPGEVLAARQLQQRIQGVIDRKGGIEILQWAASVMDRTLQRLGSHWREKDKPLDVLKTYLMDPRGTLPVADLATQLGTTVPSLKAAIYRLRKLFADLLGDEITATVTDPSEVDDELRHLLTVLAQTR